ALPPNPTPPLRQPRVRAPPTPVTLPQSRLADAPPPNKPPTPGGPHPSNLPSPRPRSPGLRRRPSDAQVPPLTSKPRPHRGGASALPARIGYPAFGNDRTRISHHGHPSPGPLAGTTPRKRQCPQASVHPMGSPPAHLPLPP